MKKQSNIVTIVGARPQFVKAAVVSKAMKACGIRERMIHTGQHYDASMSDVFFEELQIPTPAHHLEIGSGSHGAQTGRMLEKIEEVLVAKNGVADYVNVLNGRHGSFVDINGYRHPVSRLRNHLRVDRGVITPLKNILSLQFKLHALERRSLKHLSDGQTCPFQTIQQSFSLNGFIAVNRDFTNARSLSDHDNQDTPISGNRNVIEVTRRKQAFRCRTHCKGIDSVTHPDG